MLDSVAWAHDRLLPELTVRDRLGTRGRPPVVRDAAPGPRPASSSGSPRAVADEVVRAAAATCCGFAGDRGLLHPELPLAATADEAAELRGRDFDAHLCSNRTCEIGLQQGTGRGVRVVRVRAGAGDAAAAVTKP